MIMKSILAVSFRYSFEKKKYYIKFYKTTVNSLCNSSMHNYAKCSKNMFEKSCGGYTASFVKCLTILSFCVKDLTFQPIAAQCSLYIPLKTSKSVRCFDVFRGYKGGTLGSNGLIREPLAHLILYFSMNCTFEHSTSWQDFHG